MYNKRVPLVLPFGYLSTEHLEGGKEAQGQA